MTSTQLTSSKDCTLIYVPTPCAAAKTPAITGRAGTLARKRQLRQVLDHRERDHADDVFASTPYRDGPHANVGVPAAALAIALPPFDSARPNRTRSVQLTLAVPDL